MIIQLSSPCVKKKMTRKEVKSLTEKEPICMGTLGALARHTAVSVTQLKCAPDKICLPKCVAAHNKYK